ncbi:MAG: hypothetical protein PHO56_04330 [Patescibacteria group bacterium]|nr:hypothetical protein [Patescibacteria group bacterium]
MLKALFKKRSALEAVLDRIKRDLKKIKRERFQLPESEEKRKQAKIPLGSLPKRLRDSYLLSEYYSGQPNEAGIFGRTDIGLKREIIRAVLDRYLVAKFGTNSFDKPSDFWVDRHWDLWRLRKKEH